MHEFSIATDIIETVSEFAESHPDKKILKVLLQIGELTCVAADQLKFCYQSIVKETNLEDSKLEIEIVSALVKCPHCNYEGKPRYWDNAQTISIPTLQCPKCGHAAEAIAGHECTIKSVKLFERKLETAF